MLLPSKGVSPERSIVMVGGEVLKQLEDGPTSVSGLWERIRRSRFHRGSELTFDWFALSLAYLYAIDAVHESSDGRLERGRDVPA